MAKKNVKKFTKYLRIDRVQNWTDEDKKQPKLYLIDSIWPVGVRKERLALQGWPKELAPSEELRKRFQGTSDEPTLGYKEFSAEYQTELDQRLENGELDEILPELKQGLKKTHKKIKKKQKKRKSLKKKDKKRGIVLLYTARDEDNQHAKILKKWLKKNL